MVMYNVNDAPAWFQETLKSWNLDPMSKLGQAYLSFLDYIIDVNYGKRKKGYEIDFEGLKAEIAGYVEELAEIDNKLLEATNGEITGKTVLSKFVGYTIKSGLEPALGTGRNNVNNLKKYPDDGHPVIVLYKTWYKQNKKRLFCTSVIKKLESDEAFGHTSITKQTGSLNPFTRFNYGTPFHKHAYSTAGSQLVMVELPILLYQILGDLYGDGYLSSLMVGENRDEFVAKLFATEITRENRSVYVKAFATKVMSILHPHIRHDTTDYRNFIAEATNRTPDVSKEFYLLSHIEGTLRKKLTGFDPETLKTPYGRTLTINRELSGEKFPTSSIQSLYVNGLHAEYAILFLKSVFDKVGVYPTLSYGGQFIFALDYGVSLEDFTNIVKTSAKEVGIKYSEATLVSLYPHGLDNGYHEKETEDTI